MKHPFYPYLIAILYPLALLGLNIQQVHSTSAWRLVLGTLILTAVIWEPVWYFWLSKYKWIRKLTGILNAAGIGAISVPIIIIAWNGLPRDIHLRKTHPLKDGSDYYFILLDSYTSHTVLQERFGYDDSPFLNGLRDLGFSVGECISLADNTADSLPIMLNGGAAPDTDPWEAIQHSQLRADLESQGYSTWAFSSGWVFTEIFDADLFLKPPPGPMTEFEAFVFKHSPLNFVLDFDTPYGENFRIRTHFLLEHLPDAAEDPGRQFVFAHIIQPHPPFVFDAEGNATNWADFRNPDYKGQKYKEQFPEYLLESYETGYIAQVEYIGKALLPVLAEILDRSTEPPYILVTGDHGPWYPTTPQEAYQILCAEHK